MTTTTSTINTRFALVVANPLKSALRALLFPFLQPTWPDVEWEPLGPINVIDRGLSADPEKKSLSAAAKKIKYLTPAIGVEVDGIDLRQLSDTQKDEL